MFDFDIEPYYEKYINLAGVDEVCRGPLAGPVVACAVIMQKGKYIDRIKESKKLSEKKRIILDKAIREEAIAIGIGVVDEKVIDEINIKQATLKAMKIAVERLKDKDGNIIKPDMV